MTDERPELTNAIGDALRTELTRQWGAEFDNYTKDVDWSLMARAALNAHQVHQRHAIGSRPVRDMRAKHVYMDGLHNPIPSERKDAMRFIEDLIGQGWRPDGRKLESVLDHAVNELELMCCPTKGGDDVITRARKLLGYPG